MSNVAAKVLGPAIANELRILSLELLKLSDTDAQAERRRHLDKAKIEELSESIKTVGMLQPIVVRPCPFREVGEELFEIVAGERRYLAAKHAKFETINVIVRDLTDEQVLEIQLVENLQRQDLHELAEAEGYEGLQKLGYTAEEIADKVGKSKGTVYARMKLLALCKEARTAFYAGELTASTALLLARIPGDDQQQRALKHITEKDYHGRVMSYRDASKYVHETFMLKLSDAPFPREDLTLVPKAGACSACPMRTGNAPDLFGDVKSADVCTNPTCFQAKKAAHVKRELEKAKASGEQVIRGADAKRILPANGMYSYSFDGSHKQLRNGFARPSDKCLDDPKKRTYAELAGKDAPKVLLQNPDTGRVEKIFNIEAIADRLKSKGIKPKPPAKDSAEAREQDNARRQQERANELQARQAIFRAIIAAAPRKLGRDDLAAIICNQVGYCQDQDLYPALGWEPPKKNADGHNQKEFFDRLRKLSEGQLVRMSIAFSVIDEAVDAYGKPTDLEALAKRLGVDVKKVRAAAAAPKPNPAPAKAAKKNAARKAK